MARTIEVKYQVTTPLFCEGVRGSAPQVRLSSFKGVLRFWWRALAWSRYRRDLKTISDLEGAVFGSSTGGQSRLLMTMDPQNEPPESYPIGTPLLGRGFQGLPYVGYGVLDNQCRTTRPCLGAPFEFTVRMRGRGLTGEQIESLNRALIAMGTLGSMGAKSRKGFGSLNLQSLRIDGKELWQNPTTIEKLKEVISDLTSESKNVDGLAEYTALSRNSLHVLLVSSSRDSLELLDKLGGDLRISIRGNRPQQRIAFGLPRQMGRGGAVRIPGSWNRRSSPLLFHIHDCGGKWVAVVSFLPSRFLPESRAEDVNEFYRPVYDFLGGLQSSSYSAVLRI